MSSVRPPELLDHLESKKSISLNVCLWRVVRQDRVPTICHSSGGRWDDGTFDVLYTSQTSDGAKAEMYFHLRRGQPVMPSKPIYRLHELKINCDDFLDLTDHAELAELGINMKQFGKLSYQDRTVEYAKCQEIGEAAYFLGHRGIVVPNARWATTNAVVFCDSVPPGCLEETGNSDNIDWRDWALKNGQ